MRTVLNISLPKEGAAHIKRRARRLGFASTSEYIRFLLDLDTDLISPDALLEFSKKADQEYKTGRLKKYQSLKDLTK